MNIKLKTAIALTVFIFLACTVFYVFFPKENSIFMPITDFIAIAFGMIAELSALFTSKAFGWKKSREGKVWFFLALGYLGWAIGEIVWTLNDIILKTSPSPSGADIFYICAYVPLLMGLWMEYHIIKENVKRDDILKAFLLTFTMALISAFLVLIPLAAASDYEMLSKGLSLFYPIADL